MISYLMVAAAVAVGYAIPVMASLFFSMLVGKMMPKMLMQGGRLQPGFLVLHGLVWMAASAAAGYLIGAALPDLRMVACAGAAMLLILALLSNVGEMKKQQGPVRVAGMVMATVAGFAGGLAIFLRMVKTAG